MQIRLWQLRNAFASFGAASFDTDQVIDYLSKHNLISNVEIDEVRRVEWKADSIATFSRSWTDWKAPAQNASAS